jgi:hypothetical protein
MDIHPENRVMTHLARSLGAHLRLDDGALTGALPLPLRRDDAVARPAAA